MVWTTPMPAVPADGQAIAADRPGSLTAPPARRVDAVPVGPSVKIANEEGSRSRRWGATGAGRPASTKVAFVRPDNRRLSASDTGASTARLDLAGVSA
jgi:hypothetical protein